MAGENQQSTNELQPDRQNGRAIEYIDNWVEETKGALGELERRVIESVREQEILAKNLNDEFATQLTFGEKLSDRLASFGGSWTFIIIFFVILSVWIGFNSIGLLHNTFDPYPYILLNLVLSCTAALQAPVIMMSQNRQETKDRLRGEHDYQVNLKAELEIRQLHLKVDQLMTHQWTKLIEIQQQQMRVLEEQSELLRKMTVDLKRP